MKFPLFPPNTSIYFEAADWCTLIDPDTSNLDAGVPGPTPKLPPSSINTISPPAFAWIGYEVAAAL